MQPARQTELPRCTLLLSRAEEGGPGRKAVLGGNDHVHLGITWGPPPARSAKAPCGALLSARRSCAEKTTALVVFSHVELKGNRQGCALLVWTWS